jgi:C4-dicarboxylate-specific signal transduction histidine kinase
MHLRLTIQLLAGAAIILTLFSGVYYLASAREAEIEAFSRDRQEQARLLARTIDTILDDHKVTLDALAGLDQLRRAPLTLQADQSATNSFLESLQGALKLEALYLMALDGTTVAASNHDTEGSFVGKDYSFRPYFREALKGETTVYFALGATSGVRGVYTGAPVRDDDGRVIGVLVSKSGVNALRDGFSVQRGATVALTSPDGVVFLSSKPAWLFKSLWRLPETTQQRLIDARQFGTAPFAWLGFEKRGPTTARDRQGQTYKLYSKRLRSVDGWQLISLHEAGLVSGTPAHLLPADTVLKVLLVCAAALLGIVLLYRHARKDMHRRKLAERALRDSEEELRQLSEQLQHKNREYEEILFVTSHDLRSPLVSISGFNNILGEFFEELVETMDHEGISAEARSHLDPIIEGSREALHFIEGSTTKAEALIEGLLLVSRLGRVELTLEALDMNELLDEVATVFALRIREQAARLVVDRLPPCSGDRNQLNQLFSNLVGNALKYADPERPCVIKISGSSDVTSVTYRIEDNGIGISPEQQQRVFEIFKQLDPKADGQGLGLSIARKIVARHHGRIRLESEQGHGCRFFITLPREQQSDTTTE